MTKTVTPDQPQQRSSRVKTLVARGVDTQLAQKLVNAGQSAQALARLSDSKLYDLGIEKESIESLRRRRPPIPKETLAQLLYDSAWTCCVCQQSNKSILIHHIAPWSQVRTHSLDNLIVLCLECHGQAHTHHDLAQNLTPQMLLSLKRKWIDSVRLRTAHAVISPTPQHFNQEAIWDYFNHRRIIEYARMCDISIPDTVRNHGLLGSGLLDDDGLPVSLLNTATGPLPEYMYGGSGYGIRFGHSSVYRFFGKLLTLILQRSPWINLTDNWTRASIRDLVHDGTLVVLKGPFGFRRNHKPNARGPGQRRTGCRRGYGIQLSFEIDAWECTSSSAYGGTLTSRNVATAICVAKDCSMDGKLLHVASRCLAIGTQMGAHRTIDSRVQMLEACRHGDDDEAEL